MHGGVEKFLGKIGLKQLHSFCSRCLQFDNASVNQSQKARAAILKVPVLENDLRERFDNVLALNVESYSAVNLQVIRKSDEQVLKKKKH